MPDRRSGNPLPKLAWEQERKSLSQGSGCHGMLWGAHRMFRLSLSIYIRHVSHAFLIIFAALFGV
jgi:hypothetical protein